MCSWSHCVSNPICYLMLPRQLTAELENTQAASSPHGSFRGNSSNAQYGEDLKTCQIGLLTHRRQETTSFFQAPHRRHRGRDPFSPLTYSTGLTHTARRLAVQALVLCTKPSLQISEHKIPQRSSQQILPAQPNHWFLQLISRFGNYQGITFSLRKKLSGFLLAVAFTQYCSIWPFTTKIRCNEKYFCSMRADTFLRQVKGGVTAQLLARTTQMRKFLRHLIVWLS